MCEAPQRPQTLSRHTSANDAATGSSPDSRPMGGGRRFRALVLVDSFTRERLTLVAHAALSSVGSSANPMVSAEFHGRPRTLVSDRGTTLTPHAILRRRGASGRVPQRAPHTARIVDDCAGDRNRC